jgi:hypothetical protein
MKLKRFVVALTTAGTLAAVSTLAIALTPGGASAARSIALGAGRALAVKSIDAHAASTCTSTNSFSCASVSVGPNATLTDRILVQGTVTVTCGPIFSFSGGFLSGTGNISVQQASGRQVAYAYGQFNYVCDGVPHSSSWSATAGNLTFKPGGAIADANLGYGYNCGYDPNFNYVCVSGDSGPTSITIANH